MTHPGHDTWSATRKRRGEGGFVAVEFVLVISVLIVLFMLTLAYAVKAHSHRIAEAAAEQGLAAAASYTGSAAAGRATTEHYLTQLGGGLTHTRVHASRDTRTAVVTVSARAPAFLPLLPMTVHVTVRGPVERIVAPSVGGGTP